MMAAAEAAVDEEEAPLDEPGNGIEEMDHCE